MFTRDESLTFLREHNKEEMHIRHAYAVEAAMRGFAKHFGEDEDYWGLIGLMHDIDWEEFPSPIHEISISERTISLIWNFPSYSGSLDLHSSIAPECKTTDEGIMMIYSECKRIGKINDDIYYSALVTIEKNNQVVVMIFQSNSNTGTAYSGTAIKN